LVTIVGVGDKSERCSKSREFQLDRRNSSKALLYNIIKELKVLRV
jgi:hypothetical protein